jgi:hypothetical protein
MSGHPNYGRIGESGIGAVEFAHEIPALHHEIPALQNQSTRNIIFKLNTQGRLTSLGGIGSVEALKAQRNISTASELSSAFNSVAVELVKECNPLYKLNASVARAREAGQEELNWRMMDWSLSLL